MMFRPWSAIVVLCFALGCASGDTPAGAGGGSGQGGAGGTSTGGVGGGGSGGGGAGTGGAAGSGGAGGTTPDAGVVAPDGGGSAALDECFRGLRALKGRTTQLSTKRSANGAYEVRLALEVPSDSVGTSGTLGWKAVRVGVVLPGRTACVQEEALSAAYKTSHHNCTDVLTTSQNGLTYELKSPDSDPRRGDTTLSVTGEGAILPVKLMTVSCVGPQGGACRSGGPCQ